MQPDLAVIRQELATQAGIIHDLDSLVAVHNSVNAQNEGSAIVEATADLSYLTTQIQSVLDQGNPLLNSFRDQILARFVGMFSAVFNENISYFVPNEADKITLVKTRVKSAESMLRKLTTGKTIFDEFGATLVAKTWDDINKDVRPWLEDNFHVIPELGKFYVDGMDRPHGYVSSSMEGRKSTGYQGQHMVVLYPLPGIQQSIPIDIHLYDQASFLDNEFGSAALDRHLSQDLNTAIQLISLMGLNSDTLYKLFSRKIDGKTIVAPSGKTWYIGNGYATKADQCRELALEKKLPIMYEGITRFMGDDGLNGFPDLDSDKATAVVDSIMEQYPTLQQPGRVNGELFDVVSGSFIELVAIADYNNRVQIKKTPAEIDSNLRYLKEQETMERQMMRLN